MASATSTLSTEPLSFSVDLDENDDRIDCAWFNPVARDKINSLKHASNKRKLTSLKSVSDVNYGKRLPAGTVVTPDEASVIPFIRASDIKNLRVNWESSVKLPREIHQAIQKYQIKKDDIVITIVGTIGQVGLLRDELEVCDVSDNAARIHVTDPNILPEFLLYILDSEYVKTQTERFSVGSLQYKLSMQSCRNIEIYIPFDGESYDTKEQEQILNEVHQLLEEAHSERRKGLELIKQSRAVVAQKLGIMIPDAKSGVDIFEQSLTDDLEMRLDALFNNPLRKSLLNSLKKNPHNTLGNLTKKPVTGRLIPADFYKLIDLEQVDESIGQIVNVKEVSKLGSEKVLLASNTLLISKMQPEKGKVAIIPNEYDGAVGSSEFIPLALDSADVTLEYLWSILRSDYVLMQWAYALTGSSRMRIGQKELDETIIPLPSPKIQSEIVDAVNERVSAGRLALKKADQLQRSARKVFSEKVFFNN